MRQYERLKVLESTRSYFITWITNECPINVVDDLGNIVPGSKFIFCIEYNYTYSTGDILTLPITDNGIYNGIVGPYADGYWLRLLLGH